MIPRRWTDRRRRPECSARGPGAGRGLADRRQHRPTPSALGYLTPTNYAKTWTTNHPELSYRVDQQPGSGQRANYITMLASYPDDVHTEAR